MKPLDNFKILLVDDDPDDRMLAKDAISENNMHISMDSATDGEDMLEYLSRAFAAGGAMPDLILLDLNMPRMGGRQAIIELRKDERFNMIPVIVFTTSTLEEDITYSYRHGVNTFVRKPASFAALVALFNTLCSYWFRFAEIPRRLA